MLKVVGLNPSTILLHGHFSHMFVVKLKYLFEKTDINEKEAGYDTFLNR